LLTKGGIGGSFNLGYSWSTTRVFEGRSLTWGETLAATGTGMLFAPGMVGVTRFSGQKNGMINGSIAGFSGELTAQTYDSLTTPDYRFSSERLVISSFIGGAAGAVGGTANPYYAYRPTIGNAQTYGAGVRYGLRTQIDAFPPTGAAYITQFHLDGVRVLVEQGKK
jgi:hypothetical protein